MNHLFIFLFTTSDWINSIAAIAAFLTAIITFLTVIEIKKQREHSYHPEINVANIEFYLYKSDYHASETEKKLYLFYSKRRIPENESKSGFNELAIDINNIGLAVAKQVNCYWEADIDAICKALDHKKKSIANWKIKDHFFCVTSERLNLEWVFAIEEDNEGEYFNFILPYSVENRNTQLRVPSYFTDLYWIYKVKEVLDKPYTSDMDYPPIKLHIEYTNIHGKKIKKTFLLFMKWNFIGPPRAEESELAKFNIEIIESD